MGDAREEETKTPFYVKINSLYIYINLYRCSIYQIFNISLCNKKNDENSI